MADGVNLDAARAGLRDLQTLARAAGAEHFDRAASAAAAVEAFFQDVTIEMDLQRKKVAGWMELARTNRRLMAEIERLQAGRR